MTLEDMEEELELYRQIAHLQRMTSDNIDKRTLAEDDSPMENRIEKLEEFVTDTRDRLTKIETRLDQTATKSDLHEVSASLIKWVVGTAVGLGAAAITVMTFVLGNATPKAPTPQQPIIIYGQPAPAVK